ncbi:MAG: HAD family hydrolase [Thermofilum sp.]
MAAGALRAVLFDVGGTIVYDRGFARVLSEKISAVVETHTGLRAHPQTVSELWERAGQLYGSVELWDLARVMLLLRQLGILPSLRLAEQVYAAVLDAYIEGFDVEPSAQPVMRALKDMGLKLGILTNVGSYDATKLRLQFSGLLEFVDVVVASQAFPWRKPSREIFEVSCFLLGVAPAEAVYVGDDAQVDIAGAKAAGLKAVQVLKYAKEKSPLADAWISTLEELPQAVEELLRQERTFPGS